jgi:flagellar basal-body rod protein FlgF
MDNPTYVGLTRQSGLMREMQVVANNIANMATTGFRREGVVFAEHVAATGPRDASLSMGNAIGGRFRRCRGPSP